MNCLEPISVIHLAVKMGQVVTIKFLQPDREETHNSSSLFTSLYLKKKKNISLN